MSGNGEAKGEVRKYRDNAIDGFRNGAVLDLRVRVAMEFLAHGGIFGALVNGVSARGPMSEADMVALPKTAAVMALEAATELLRLAEERGLVEDFPEGSDIGRGLKDHAKRSVHFQLEGQREAQRAQADQVRPAGPVGVLRPQ